MHFLFKQFKPDKALMAFAEETTFLLFHFFYFIISFCILPATIPVTKKGDIKTGILEEAKKL